MCKADISFKTLCVVMMYLCYSEIGYCYLETHGIASSNMLHDLPIIKAGHTCFVSPLLQPLSKGYTPKVS